MKKYEAYSEQEFLCDEYFQNWVQNPTTESENQWRGWLLTHPEKASIVSNARKMLSQISFKVEEPTEMQVQASLQQALQRIDDIERHAMKRRKVAKTFGLFIRVAAVLILLLGIGLYFYKYQERQTLHQVATAYGNMKTINLPDSSSIVLNANSKVFYKQDWPDDEPREIWLEGEAFFNVKRLDNKGRGEDKTFLVHTGKITVEVLGTKFNVRQRRNKIDIVLQSGKVKVSFKNGREGIIMKPGQIVSVDTITEDYSIHSAIETAEYISWIDKKLVLNNTSLQKVTEYLEDIYGKKIVLQDASLRDRKFQGTIMLDNLDDAFFVISKVLDIKVVKEDSTIHFIHK